jgi:recombinational DNA repair protein (RecF pathway)
MSEKPPEIGRCSRCQRTDQPIQYSPFTAEALCPDCLRQESGLLTRLRSAGSGHQAFARERNAVSPAAQATHAGTPHQH